MNLYYKQKCLKWWWGEGVKHPPRTNDDDDTTALSVADLCQIRICVGFASSTIMFTDLL